MVRRTAVAGSLAGMSFLKLDFFWFSFIKDTLTLIADDLQRTFEDGVFKRILSFFFPFFAPDIDASGSIGSDGFGTANAAAAAASVACFQSRSAVEADIAGLLVLEGAKGAISTDGPSSATSFFATPVGDCFLEATFFFAFFFVGDGVAAFAASDEGFKSIETPVSESYLLDEGLSSRFVNYMNRWPGFVNIGK